MISAVYHEQIQSVTPIATNHEEVEHTKRSSEIPTVFREVLIGYSKMILHTTDEMVQLLLMSRELGAHRTIGSKKERTWIMLLSTQHM